MYGDIQIKNQFFRPPQLPDIDTTISHVPNKEIAHKIWFVCENFNKGQLTKEWAKCRYTKEDVFPLELQLVGNCYYFRA